MIIFLLHCKKLSHVSSMQWNKKLWKKEKNNRKIVLSENCPRNCLTEVKAFAQKTNKYWFKIVYQNFCTISENDTDCFKNVSHY